MNIFALSIDPFQAASMQCDKHVVKMTLESAQILSTVMHLEGNSALAPYRSTHVKHPAVTWSKEPNNRWWLFWHFCGLLTEYTYRYNKVHACMKHKDALRPTFNCTKSDFTPADFVQCMPDVYKVPGDAISAYRAYYIGEKSRFARWKHGNQPSWWK